MCVDGCIQDGSGEEEMQGEKPHHGMSTAGSIPNTDESLMPRKGRVS